MKASLPLNFEVMTDGHRRFLSAARSQNMRTAGKPHAGAHKSQAVTCGGNSFLD